MYKCPHQVKLYSERISLFLNAIVLCLVTQSYSILWDPKDYSPPGSSVHGISQARILEWVARPSSRGSSQPRSPALQVDSLPSEPPGKPNAMERNENR